MLYFEFKSTLYVYALVHIFLYMAKFRTALFELLYDLISLLTTIYICSRKTLVQLNNFIVSYLVNKLNCFFYDAISIFKTFSFLLLCKPRIRISHFQYVQFSFLIISQNKRLLPAYTQNQIQYSLMFLLFLQLCDKSVGIFREQH